jgi:hypothetical protein
MLKLNIFFVWFGRHCLWMRTDRSDGTSNEYLMHMAKTFHGPCYML